MSDEKLEKILINSVIYFNTELIDEKNFKLQEIIKFLKEDIGFNDEEIENLNLYENMNLDEKRKTYLN